MNDKKIIEVEDKTDDMPTALLDAKAVEVLNFTENVAAQIMKASLGTLDGQSSIGLATARAMAVQGAAQARTAMVLEEISEHLDRIEARELEREARLQERIEKRRRERGE